MTASKTSLVRVDIPYNPVLHSFVENMIVKEEFTKATTEIFNGLSRGRGMRSRFELLVITFFC